MQPQRQLESTKPRVPVRNAEDEAGYMLLAVVVMVALVLLSLSVAAPMIARDIQRDKEVESEHRAQQYVRAIRLYQRKFPGQYPPSIEALEKSNNIRFLRQQYVDPLTGKSEWRLIHLGQQKTTIKIPFGEELGGIATSGLGSAAGMASPGIGSTPTLGIGGAAGGTSTIGATSALASGFSGATIGSNTSSGAGGSAVLGGAAGATGSTGSASGLSSMSASSFGTSATSGKLGSGGPIIGVGTQRSGNSILDPNQQSTYETWEFWYDPRIEQLYRRANILGGGGLGGGTGSGGINSTSASSFGSDAVSGKSNSPTSSSPTSGTTMNTPR